MIEPIDLSIYKTTEPLSHTYINGAMLRRGLEKINEIIETLNKLDSEEK